MFYKADENKKEEIDPAKQREVLKNGINLPTDFDSVSVYSDPHTLMKAAKVDEQEQARRAEEKEQKKTKLLFGEEEN